MKKFIIAAVIIILAVIIWGYYTNSDSVHGATVSASDPVVLFYGRECPHCQIVEDFLNKNNVAQKVSFKQAEVFHNSDNQKIFVDKNKACGITDENQMGVPLLWADGKCYVGQDDVIKYFQDKMNGQ